MSGEANLTPSLDGGERSPLRLGVLVSGGGTNLQAILDAVHVGRLNADLRIVVSNKAGVRALERAEAAGVPTAVLRHKDYDTRETFDEALVTSLREAGVEWVALAGFMRVLTPVFLRAFTDRIVNIHPALLPAFPGVDAQDQALAYGVKVAGCTVHFVDEGVDSGPIIAQRAVMVEESDDEGALRARILEQEHAAFVDSLQAIAEGRVSIVTPHEGRRRVRVAPRKEPTHPDESTQPGARG